MADNFIDKTRDFIQSFNELLQNTHTDQNIEGLISAEQRTSKYLENEVLHFDILCFAKEHIKEFSLWSYSEHPDKFEEMLLVPGSEIILKIGSYNFSFKNQDISGFPNQLIGIPNAPAMLVFLDPDSISLEDFETAVNKFAENKAFALLICHERSENLNDYRRILSSQTAKTIPIYADKAIKSNILFNDFLLGANFYNIIQISNSSAAAHSLEKIIDAYNLFINQIERELSAQQILAQQQNNMLQGVNVSGGKDSFRELKVRIEKYFNNFETGIKNKFEEAIRPEIGSLWLKMENMIAGMESLHKTSVGKKTVLSIPETKVKEVLDELQSFFYNNFTADIMTMNDLFNIIEKDIEREITKMGAVYLPINFRHMSADIISTILNSQIRIQSPFKSEMSNTGLYQYFMAIRQYQMIFVIIFSTFGLSFIRQMDQIMIPATIVLLGVGGYFVVKSVKKERKNTEEKELEKAVKFIQGTYQKIYVDSTRNWLSKMGEHLKTEMKDVLRTVENHVGSFVDAQKDQQKSQQQLIKRQVKSLEEREKSLKLYTKEGENIKRNIRRFRTDIRTELNKILKDIN